MSASPPRRRAVRPTSDAAGLLAFFVPVAAVALWTGENLLVLVACSLAAVMLVALVEAARAVGLARVEVRRLLPDELIAGQAVRGAVELRAPVDVPPFDLTDPGGHARVRVPGLVAGQALVVPVVWRFERRGLVTLETLVLRTDHPVGLVEVTCVADVPDEVVVWPQPLAGGHLTDGAGEALGGDDGVPDELVDLRPYRPGDPLRDVHAPTSARVGAPMVVVRRPATARAVWIEVPPVRGEAFERAVRQAAGLVVAGWVDGRPVGLRMGTTVLPPRTGPAWRRRLLEVLALARPDGGRGGRR